MDNKLFVNTAKLILQKFVQIWYSDIFGYVGIRMSLTITILPPNSSWQEITIMTQRALLRSCPQYRGSDINNYPELPDLLN